MAHDSNGVHHRVAIPDGGDNKIFTPEQMQWLLEYISLQTLVGIQDHEARMHEPANKDAFAQVKANDNIRRRAMAKLNAIFVRR